MLRRLLPLTALVLGLSTAVSPAEAVIAPDLGCRNGPVSITFDDGPNPVYTPRLLRVLHANHAQATFFVLGRNATRYPKLLQWMIAEGHAVENHSWDHPELTKMSSAKVWSEISRTSKAIKKADGVAPGLMRPPYGDTDARVRKIIAGQKLGQELWTIDTNDWRGGSVKSIKKAALRGLRPHRANVILMHDAVDNSPRTIKAVPAIIKGLRQWGYCLVPLQVTAPDAHISAEPVTIDEGDKAATIVTLRFTLDAPTQQDASFRIHTVGGTAGPGKDYAPLDQLITIKRGGTKAEATVTIFPDPMPNTNKAFSLVIDRPHHLRVATTSVPVTMTDNGDWDAERAVLISP